MHYSMGGIWHDYEADTNNNMVKDSPRQQATNIPGLYASGEADYGYHGANRLGANSLLSCIYAGQIGGPAMVSYAKNNVGKTEVDAGALDSAKKYWRERFDQIGKMAGSENPYQIGMDMGEVMTRSTTIVKRNDDLDRAVGEIQALQERWHRSNVLDTGRTLNQSATYVNQLWNMLQLGELIVRASRMRDESRGSHYKPAFQLPEPKTKDPSQDPEWMAAWRARDEKWRKTTVARYVDGKHTLSLEPIRSLEVPNPILKPEPRWYG
jgi:succinate dehydrogenase / fumarate reductase flavoprotein subunit